MDLLLKLPPLEREIPDEIRQRVLVADDRQENRYILCHTLILAGFDCVQASSGIEAIELAGTLPDIIILDVRLPDISGYEVCETIKRDPRTSAIPILQISASFTGSEDRVRALDGGADGFLTHPVDRLVLVATVRSLLRLRTAELQARKSAQHWQSTFDALTEGLALVNANNHLVRWNSAFYRICSPKLPLKVGDDAAGVVRQLAGSDEAFRLNGKKRHTTEFSIDSKTLEISITRIDSDSGNGEKILILADVTDRRLAEYALRTAEKLAATGKLANAIAHEINNPLEALINLVYLAGRADSLESVKDLLSRAEIELARIARITKQSLAFHRDTKSPVNTDVGELVADIVALFERTAGQHRVRLIYDRKPVPSILAFPGQLGQVFGNLIRNAAEASLPDTRVIVRVRAADRRGQHGVRVAIHDQGAGIPGDVQRKMFDPFFTTKDLKGSGLGLWVSRSLVVRHGGTIRFRSSESPGRNGTTFEVFLPANGLNKAAQDYS